MTTILEPSKAVFEPANQVESGKSLEQQAREIVAFAVNELNQKLFDINRAIHDHPETSYEEVFAHSTLTDFFESQGFQVQRHAYGLDTAFSAEAGSGGRLVIICAEYDALPDMGHGCGHNLIATSSSAAFVGAARALLTMGLAGRVRILGTPAEEGGAGKIRLLEAGAFAEDVSAAIMCHALPLHMYKDGWSGTAGFRSTASCRFKVEFRGRNAHAGSSPWDGVNALDGAVAAYGAVSMLRQQIKPYERMQGIIEEGGKVPNVIPDYTRMAWGLRTKSAKELDVLYGRVQACMEGAAKATGCHIDFTRQSPYLELRVNTTLCKEYIREMASLGEDVLFQDDEPSAAGTDMGNVSHEVPSFHGIFGIPAAEGVTMHNIGFADAARTPEAHERAIQAGKAMAMLAIRILSDDNTAASVKADFVKGQS